MHIQNFRIENFRNIRLAECFNVPKFMVICGGNGCGKSSILEALITAKEYAGSYGGYFQFDPRAVSANGSRATISMSLIFDDTERMFLRDRLKLDCPESDLIVIEINKGGSAKVIKSNYAVNALLSHYSQTIDSPGFFDYINAHRLMPKNNISSWSAEFLSEEQAKQTLARQENKFHTTKQYLVGVKMRDLQALQSSMKQGKLNATDSLQEIRELFDDFFAPMKFVDIYLDESPFKFVISTPSGDIDIDDLSSGEKEILNVIVRFHQLKPKKSIILFDEADAHLHPDLERRYLNLLKKLGENNQMVITTHSPEMMIAAGTESLYAVLKTQILEDSSQLVRVTKTNELHSALSELMGTRGIISFNQKIVFIEGDDSSADREIYEYFYPPNQYNISFVPAGNSGTVRKVAEQINTLLTSSSSFQQYYSIVDGDIERSEPGPDVGEVLFKLPVYHVENLLLDEKALFIVLDKLMRSRNPYKNESDILESLRSCILKDIHFKPFTKALLDAMVAKYAKQAYDAVFRGDANFPVIRPITFIEAESEAQNILKNAMIDGSWKSQCKGRDLLKAFCSLHGLKYEHVRNLLISEIEKPPQILADIMAKVLQGV